MANGSTPSRACLIAARSPDLQAAFAERNAAQCGFCTPGMLLTAHEMLRKGGIDTREDIRAFIAGNLCRCTGYEPIVDAIETVLRRRTQR